MNNNDLSLENKFCLNCKKVYCNGNCKEYQEYMKYLIDNKIIRKPGRPRKNKVD